MKIEKIRPIPKYIVELIKKKDIAYCPEQSGHTRFYSYLTKNDGELVKVTVAVKTRYNKWYCKQVAVHGIHSTDCFIKDIIYYHIGGYVAGWHDLGLSKYLNWYEQGWDYSQDKYFDPYAPLVNIDYALKFP